MVSGRSYWGLDLFKRWLLNHFIGEIIQITVWYIGYASCWLFLILLCFHLAFSQDVFMLLLFVGFIHGWSSPQCVHGLWREIIADLDGFRSDFIFFIFFFGFIFFVLSRVWLDRRILFRKSRITGCVLIRLMSMICIIAFASL